METLRISLRSLLLRSLNFGRGWHIVFVDAWRVHPIQSRIYVTERVLQSHTLCGHVGLRLSIVLTPLILSDHVLKGSLASVPVCQANAGVHPLCLLFQISLTAMAAWDNLGSTGMLKFFPTQSLALVKYLLLRD